MNDTKTIRTARMFDQLSRLGIRYNDADTLRRIQLQLHTWDERQCGADNGCVVVEDDGKAYWQPSNGGKPYRIPNRGAGAERRLAAIIGKYPDLAAYHQSDCRGCALYVYQLEALKQYADRFPHTQPRYTIDACYSSIGVAVCI